MTAKRRRADERRVIRHELVWRWRIALRLSALIWAFGAVAPAALAVLPSEMLRNPVLEARAEHIGRELRCLVCRNQSIEESQADLAHDLRLLVRRRLVAGDSDAQVIAYIRSRYGDYVLLDPPFEIQTWLLWGGPPLVLFLGAGAIAGFYRRRRNDSPPGPLNPDEQRRLAAALGEAGET
jgi:cytochrome c-type biogenesis protein CcmH